MVFVNVKLDISGCKFRTFQGCRLYWPSFLSNDTTKTSLAMLALLYCKEFVKTSLPRVIVISYSGSRSSQVPEHPTETSQNYDKCRTIKSFWHLKWMVINGNIISVIFTDIFQINSNIAHFLDNFWKSVNITVIPMFSSKASM